MGRTTTSLRLDDGLREDLAALAGAEGTTLTAVVERLLREGLAIERHPGIVFKPGPSGRRAALAGGPDVWEIIATLRDTPGSEAERVRTLSTEFDFHERDIAIAVGYAAAHRAEIEERIHANDRALEEVEHLSEERRRLLA